MLPAAMGGADGRKAGERAFSSAALLLGCGFFALILASGPMTNSSYLITYAVISGVIVLIGFALRYVLAGGRT